MDIPCDPATDLVAYIAGLSYQFALLESYDEAKSEHGKLYYLEAALAADASAFAAITAGKVDAEKGGLNLATYGANLGVAT